MKQFQYDNENLLNPGGFGTWKSLILPENGISAPRLRGYPYEVAFFFSIKRFQLRTKRAPDPVRTMYEDSGRPKGKKWDFGFRNWLERVSKTVSKVSSDTKTSAEFGTCLNYEYNLPLCISIQGFYEQWGNELGSK